MIGIPTFAEEPIACLLWTVRLFCLAQFASSISQLAAWRDYRAGGILSWENAATQRGRILRLPGVSLLLRSPGFLWLLGIKLVASVVLFFFPVHPVYFPLFTAILFFTTTIGDLRDRWLFNPVSRILLSILATALFVIAIAGFQKPQIQNSGLLFIALTSTGAYFFSAIAKFREPLWRDGGKVFDILNGHFMGNPTLARWFHTHPIPGKLLTWHVVGAELFFPSVWWWDGRGVCCRSVGQLDSIS